MERASCLRALGQRWRAAHQRSRSEHIALAVRQDISRLTVSAHECAVRLAAVYAVGCSLRAYANASGRRAAVGCHFESAAQAAQRRGARAGTPQLSAGDFESLSTDLLASAQAVRAPYPDLYASRE